MKFKQKRYALLLGVIIAELTAGSFAGASVHKFGEPILANLFINNSSHLLQADTVPQKKQVMLMNIPLTLETRKAILSAPSKSIKTVMKQKWLHTKGLPHSFDIGMNDVPVLDQGRHGTCVTFATTAAVDAVLGKGDYVSQLCNLGLGRYLEEQDHSLMPSGWNGSYGSWIMDQMMRFGVVSKDTQNTSYCGGIKNYPLTDSRDMANPVSPDEFAQHSETLIDHVYYSQLMSFEKRINAKFQNYPYAMHALDNIKKSINEGHRVIFSTFLILNPQCSVGACASYHQQFDTWAVTKELQSPAQIGGHEMVFIGYDDDAVALDSEGNKHKGLLKIRNSWGVNAGDHGDYYMSYDYFIMLANDADEVGAIR